MKRYSFCSTFSPTAYASNDSTIIHHVYKPEFAVCVPFFTTGSWDLFVIKSVAVFGLVSFRLMVSTQLSPAINPAETTEKKRGRAEYL